MPNAPSEDHIETLLETTRPEPGKTFYRKMANAPWTRVETARRASQPTPLVRLAAMSTLVLLLIAGGLMLTPTGQVLTQSLFRLFASDGSEPMPAATLAATSQPVSTSAPVIRTPQPTQDPLYPFTEALYSLEAPLNVIEAEAQAGFEVIVPGYIPTGFWFRGAKYVAKQKQTWLVYAANFGGVEDPHRSLIYIFQQRLEDYVDPGCPDCEAGHPPDIEAVQIGNVTGEYIGASWTHYQVTALPGAAATPTPVWSQTPSLRSLEWKTETMHYMITSLGSEEYADNLDKASLVGIAESILTCAEPENAQTYPCAVNRAKATAKFLVKTPPGDIAGLVFADASAAPDSVQLRYAAISGGSELTVSQTLTNLPSLLKDELPEAAAVESVKVGEAEGEYAQGALVTKPGETTEAWEPTAPVRRLRWYESGVLFEIRLMGHTASVEYLERDTLIALAESLTYQPQVASAQLRPDYLTSIADAETISGFDLLEPEVLPEGFAFRYAEYNAEVNYVRMVYEFGDQTGVAGIVIFQSPAAGSIENSADGMPPGSVEFIEVNGYPAVYSRGAWEVRPADPNVADAPTPTPIWHGDASHQAIFWQQAGMHISVVFIAGEVYEGELTQAKLLAVAESMK